MAEITIDSVLKLIQKEGNMYKKKLKELELIASIDTMAIATHELSQQEPEETTYINKCITNLAKDGSRPTRFTYIINPNKTTAGEILRYSDFESVFQDILEAMEIREYHKCRVDFRIDSMQDNYNELLKLNKCLILLLAYKYNINNRYQSFDPLLLDDLTIRIQNDYIEAENYNKGIQSPDGDVKNRLELRTKGQRKDKPVSDMITAWATKLDACVSVYGELQDQCNLALFKKWQNEKHGRVKSLSEFLRKYQDNIFCRKQLIGFFQMLNHGNAIKAADNFKRSNSIEFFTTKDIKDYIWLIKKSLQNYLLQ